MIRKILYLVIASSILVVYLGSCANQGSPSGGPKDTIPPILISSYPTINSKNFEDKEIRLVFSERVNAEKLKKELIITPKFDSKYKFYTKNDELIIQFEDAFEDDFTYLFNFRQGVVDVTEKNSIKNLKLAFSTGETIDSILIQGKVIDLLTKKPKNNFLVGLYLLNDTIEYFLNFPHYFIYTNKYGVYEISNVKGGRYHLLAFNDENNNLKLDLDKEGFCFLEDTLNITDSIKDINIESLNVNSKKLTFINNYNRGKIHEIKYNKPIKKYKLSDSTFHSNLDKEDNSKIILYRNPINPIDSSSIVVNSYDTLKNFSRDTLKITFDTTYKTKKKFTSKFIDFNKKNDVIAFNISSNQPIYKIDKSKFFLKIDSSHVHPVSPFTYYFNKDKTLINIESNLKNIITDSLMKKDTITRENFEINLEKGALISILSDSSKDLTYEYKGSTKESEKGVLKLNVITDYKSFELQIIKKKEIVKRIINEKKITINLQSGEYKIRVFIDENNNGKWDVGDIWKGVKNEKVHLEKKSITIRQNWVIEDVDINF